jgi:hypothetical protein
MFFYPHFDFYLMFLRFFNQLMDFLADGGLANKIPPF